MRLPSRRGLLLIAGAVGVLAWVYRPFFSGELLVGRDAFRFFIPARAFLLECLGRGELPLWNPYLRLGQPFAASLISQGLYPPTWLTSALFGAARGFTVQQLLHAVLAAGGAFWAARMLRCSRPAAVAAGLAFAVSPMFTDLSGHRNVIDAATWSGFLVASAVSVARTGGRAGTLGLGVFATLSFFAGSPETLVWQLLLVAAVFLGERPTREGWKSAGIAAALCLGLSAVLLLPAIEFLRLTTRGAGSPDATDWSVSWPQLLAMGWPRADQPRGEYWGDDQWWMVTVFVGTAPCLLALASLRRSRRWIALASVTALLAALALGKHLPLTAWLWTHGPLGAFRFPAKFLVGVAFGVALLSAGGVDRLTAMAWRRRLSGAWIAAAVGIAFVGILAGPPLLRVLGARPGAIQGLLWVLGAALALCIATLLPRSVAPRKPNANAVTANVGAKRQSRGAPWHSSPVTRISLSGVVLLELLLHHGLNKAFGWERPTRLDAPSTLAAAIPPDFHGRISLPMTDALVGERDPSLPSFIDSSRDSLIPNRHMEERLRALEGYGAPEPRWLDEVQLIGKRSVFDLTGVQFYVRAGGPPSPELERVGGGPGLSNLYRSSTAMPRAFVVHRAEVVPSNTALEKLWDPAQPARTTVYLESGAKLDAPCEGSTAAFQEDEANRVVVSVKACGDGYLVLSDVFFPGWTAEVDGRETELHRANYAMRAVALPAGEHTVSFRYRPRSFVLGALISLATLLLALVRKRGLAPQVPVPAVRTIERA